MAEKEKERDFNAFSFFFESRVPNPLVIALGEKYFPEKFNLKVLWEVWVAAKCLDSLRGFNWTEEVWEPDTFDYGEYTWASTIECRRARYQLKGVSAPKETFTFINVKLPNDGYLYKSDLDLNGELKYIEEADNFMNKIMTDISSLPLFSQRPLIRVDYSAQAGRLSIYFIDRPNRRILTVKFEYGSPEGPKKEGKNIRDWAANFQWKQEKNQ